MHGLVVIWTKLDARAAPRAGLLRIDSPGRRAFSGPPFD
jgi:hypothetical protein